jgi:hypothetical protein
VPSENITPSLSLSPVKQERNIPKRITVVKRVPIRSSRQSVVSDFSGGCSSARSDIVFSIKSNRKRVGSDFQVTIKATTPVLRPRFADRPDFCLEWIWNLRIESIASVIEPLEP